MFMHNVFRFLPMWPQIKTSQQPLSARLRLEELEDRVVPSFATATYTNAIVQITPGFTVTEKVTATVTPFQSIAAGPQIIDIPAGATPPTSGKLLFNLNNQQQSAALNGSNQATVTFQVPLLAFLTSQTLEVDYLGVSDSSGDNWQSSTFLAPLYKNFDNLLLPATLTFNQLTPQQVYAQFIAATSSPSSQILTPYNSAQGENDDFGLFSFQYVDPGIIDAVTILGIQLPGIFAIQLGAYGSLTSSSNSP